MEVWEFDRSEQLVEFALSYSKEHDIVESKDWANLCYESGRTGAPLGMQHSEESKDKIRVANKGKIVPDEVRRKIAATHTGMKRSVAARASMSKAQKGRIFTQQHRDNLSKALKGKKK